MTQTASKFYATKEHEDGLGIVFTFLNNANQELMGSDIVFDTPAEAVASEEAWQESNQQPERSIKLWRITVEEVDDAKSE